jgi:lysozyme
MPNVLPDFYKLAAIKEHFEGFKLNAYKDSGGVWTVGFGSTFNHDAKRKVQEGDTVTKEIATRWMSVDVSNIVSQLNKYITSQLNPSQSAALVDYVYNRGIGNLLKTQLDELINANPFDPLVLVEIKKTGLKDRAGNLLWGLGRRRLAEAYLYQTGQLKFDWPRWK